jgi:uncharacterized damage-inducible protein DinB
MFRTHPEAVEAKSSENRARNYHDRCEPLFAQEPPFAATKFWVSTIAILPGEYNRGVKMAQTSLLKRETLMAQNRPTHPTIAQAAHVMKDVYLPRIAGCLKQLTSEQIWWRPNEASNSVGNLVLHLEGNVRQWLISGLDGETDNRQRDQEFSARGPLPRKKLITRLEKTVMEACGILHKISAEDLAKDHKIQGYEVSGWEAAFHVAEHFSHHAGQIILLTKMLKARDLRFTQLPGEKRKTSKKLPTW